jgi:hypothetical protein
LSELDTKQLIQVGTKTEDFEQNLPMPSSFNDDSLFKILYAKKVKKLKSSVAIMIFDEALFVSRPSGFDRSRSMGKNNNYGQKINSRRTQLEKTQK